MSRRLPLLLASLSLLSASCMPEDITFTDEQPVMSGCSSDSECGKGRRCEASECLEIPICDTSAGECDPDAQCGCDDAQTCVLNDGVAKCQIPCTASLQGNGSCDGPSGTGICESDGDDGTDCCAEVQKNGTCDGPSGTGICESEQDDSADCCAEVQENGTCDGPSGTGICESEQDDGADCCAEMQENGTCDDPSGTGICPTADADLADCCDIARHGSDAECDPLLQCGCGPTGRVCRAFVPEGGELAPVCAIPGEQGELSVCEQTGDCAAGMHCFNGLCSLYCDLNAESRCFDGDGQCVPYAESDDLGVCVLSCSPRGPDRCPAERPCRSFGDFGYLCGRPQEETSGSSVRQRCAEGMDCPPGTGCFFGLCTAPCDPAASGADCDGMCRPLTEELSLCVSPCEPASQQSCNDGEVCFNDRDGGFCAAPQEPCPENWQNDGECDGPSGTGLCTRDASDAEDCMTPTWNTCASTGDCANGESCILGVCSPSCVPGATDCAGHCLNLEAGGRCMPTCDADGGAGCAADQACLKLEDSGICIVPLDPCPTDFQGDNRCDGPSGTRFCRNDADDPDCG